MNIAAADTIGRTLARLGQMTARAGAETDTSRDNISRILAEAQAPMTVEEISELTGLHVNTIRTHLEVLRAGGKVERTRQAAEGRGRPKWLYAPAKTKDPYHRLAAQLTKALAQADSETAEEAAQRWRGADHIAAQPAETADEAVAVAAAALQQLGFEIEVSPVGDTVYLSGCPYAALVADHPIICDIHANALEQVLAGTEQDVRLGELDIYPRPGVCVAHLKRGDTKPARIVRGKRRSS
jgi:predicted ArsR family transcriptional regulator